MNAASDATWHSNRRRQWHWGMLLTLCLIFALTLAACANTPSSTKGTGCAAASTLTGAGSTFDAPLFNKLFSVYPTIPCGLPVNYSPVGSGAGIAQLLNQLVDFGATDAPLTDRQLATSSNGAILHVPVTLGAVAISYHLTGIAAPLHFSGDVVANIYLGQVTAWDDPAIAKLNPGVPLPHRPIQILHRSDGSGTTAIFTRYLAEISAVWKQRIGTGTSVSWPSGEGKKGSGGIAEALTSTEGSLGYIEWSYVEHAHLAVAQLQNAAGTFLAPSIASMQAAADSFETVPADLRFYVVNAPGGNAYPLVGYSWVIAYRHQSDVEKGKALTQLLWWMIHDGQRSAAPLNYAPLPATMVTRGEAQIRTMTCGPSSTPCFSR